MLHDFRNISLSSTGRRSSRFAAVCGAVSAAALFLSAGTAKAQIDLTGYPKTFGDEFNGLSASRPADPWTGQTWETTFWYDDASREHDQTLFLDPSFGGLGVTPFWIQTYGDGNGTLHTTTTNITPAMQAAMAPPATALYTSGQIDSYQTFSQMYGYFEARCQTNGYPGTGTAFWMLPEFHTDPSDPAEIDVFEIQGKDHNTVYQTNHSTGYPTGQDQYWPTASSDLSQNFHTFGLLWTPDLITWYVDGAPTFHTPTQADEYAPFYLVLSSYAGGPDWWWGSPVGAFSSDTQCDYIHAYQLPSGVTYQAENATLSGCATDNGFSGHQGNGYVYWWNFGSSMTLPVSVATGGMTQLKFRYSNDSGTTQTMAVYVNGVKAQNIGFLPTASSSTWSTSSISASLLAGYNTISLHCETGANGACAVDNLTVKSPVIYEAENGTTAGCSTDSTYSGHQGNGYVFWWNNPSSVSIPVGVSSTDDYTVSFRYSNGNLTQQTMAVYVNGVKAQNITLQPTGAWTNWTTTPQAPIHLNQGTNTITVKCETADGANGVCALDNITVQ